MGRPLKIQKTSTGSGNGGAAVSVDLAFPNFGSLTAPVVNTANTLNTTQYLGVVGGAAPTDTPTTTNPRVDVIVNIANPSGTGIGVAQGYIIRQKGSHKYLVGDATGVNDGSVCGGPSLSNQHSWHNHGLACCWCTCQLWAGHYVHSNFCWRIWQRCSQQCGRVCAG
jgi:hypothetical protein